jgi:hypothetical protein
VDWVLAGTNSNSCFRQRRIVQVPGNSQLSAKKKMIIKQGTYNVESVKVSMS